MTQIVPTKTRLEQAIELVSQLSLDEIKQLFHHVPILKYRSVVEERIQPVSDNEPPKPKTKKIQLGLLQDKRIVIHDDFAMSAEELLSL